MGDIFEGGADLTILPCSAKGTFTSAAKDRIAQYKLPTPLEIQDHLHLGDVTAPTKFPGPLSKTKYISYAASVLNDATSSSAIQRIGENLGQITQENPDIRIVEAPLLGSGHGRLATVPAGRSLARGFLNTGHQEAILWLFVWDHERYSALQKAIKERWTSRLLDSLLAQPGAFGFKIDLKKLFGLDK